MDRELIEVKKSEIKEFFMETLELEEFPEKWNVFLRRKKRGIGLDSC